MQIHIIRYSLGLLAVLLIASSCKKELKAPALQPLSTGVFSASKDQITIDASKPSDTAVVLSWDAYPNQLISYTMIFSAGNKQDSVQVASNVVSQTFSNAELNKILVNNLALTIGTQTTITVVLQAVIPSNGKSATSNAVSLKVTPAKVGPLYSQLWLVGDVASNGWNINNPNQMTVDVFDPYVFHYYEVLNAGEFKIPTATGNWSGDYYRPLTNNPPITDTTAALVFGNTNPPDNKWKITNAGPYKISLNILNNSIHITPFTPYTAVWMVGDATPAGWNIDNPAPMTMTANPYVFTYTGPLSAGEFKIPVTTGNWSCDYFRPAQNHPPLTDHNAPFVKNGSAADALDWKWQITQAGTYVVTLDQLHETVTIVKQ